MKHNNIHIIGISEREEAKDRKPVLKVMTENFPNLVSWFSEKINKIDKPLTRLMKKKREKTQINKIRNERKVTTDTTEIQRIVRNYNEQLYAKKLDKLGKMNNFLETYNLPKLNQEEAENLNRQIKTSEIEAVITKLQANKSPGPKDFPGKFYQTFKEEPSISNYSKHFKRRKDFQALSTRPLLS